MSEQKHEFEEALLITTSDIVELEYITDMLKDLDISYRAKQETEQFVSMFYGKSAPAVNIYVDEERLCEAKELIKPAAVILDIETASESEVNELPEDEHDEDDEFDAQEKVLWKYKRAFLYALLSPFFALLAIDIVIVVIAVIYLFIVKLFS